MYVFMLQVCVLEEQLQRELMWHHSARPGRVETLSMTQSPASCETQSLTAQLFMTIWGFSRLDERELVKASWLKKL